MFTRKPLMAGGFAMALATSFALPAMPQIVFEAPDMGGKGSGKSADQLAEEIKASHAQALDKVKELAEDALGKAEKGEELSKSIKATTDEAMVKMNELGEQVTQLEQKMSRHGSDGQDDHEKSLGEQFTESDRFKNFSETGFDRSSSARLDVKASITTLTTNAAGSVGDGIVPNRLPTVEAPQRRLTIRDLLMPGRTDSPNLEYPKETGFNNNAAPVAEGAAKPQSDIQLAMVQTATKVIAHHFKVSRQALSDVAQLRSMIDRRGVYGVKLAEENQLLNGDGTGQNLLGIIPQATAYAAAFAPTNPTAIDTIRLAILQAVLAEYPASGVVLNPLDWARIELTKNTNNDYIIGNPEGSLQPSLWRLPVVETQAIASDKFLTGAFDAAAQIFDQWLVSVAAGYVDDDFTRNMITLLFEERLALAVYRPEGFIYGDLGYEA